MADAGRWVVTVGVKYERDLSRETLSKFLVLICKVAGPGGKWPDILRRWR